jgi:hypothetical protein
MRWREACPSARFPVSEGVRAVGGRRCQHQPVRGSEPEACQEPPGIPLVLDDLQAAHDLRTGARDRAGIDEEPPVPEGFLRLRGQVESADRAEPARGGREECAVAGPDIDQCKGGCVHAGRDSAQIPAIVGDLMSAVEGEAVVVIRHLGDAGSLDYAPAAAADGVERVRKAPEIGRAAREASRRFHCTPSCVRRRMNLRSAGVK